MDEKMVDALNSQLNAELYSSTCIYQWDPILNQRI